MATLDVFADLVCPWCWLGKRHLDLALERVEDAPAVRYRAYQLQPGVPPEGIDIDDYFRSKFGDPRSVDDAHARLTEMGADVGLTYRFAARTRFPNTFEPHRAVAIARSLGGAAAEAAAMESLFRAYFELGIDIGDRQGIVQALDATPIPVEIVELMQRFDSGEGVEDVSSDYEYGRELGVQGVPLFVNDRMQAVSGAQPPDVLQHFVAASATGVV